MSTNDEIAQELAKENQRREQEKQTPIKISHAQVSAAKYAWTLGAIAVDIATAYVVWQITYWWYGAMWFVAGAGGLVYSEWLRERVGNNQEQQEISKLGVVVSGLSILLVAVLAGVVYVLGYTKVAWVEVVTLVWVLALFFYHLLQSYRFHVKDDEYIEQTKEARSEEESQRQIRSIHRAARRVEAKKHEGDWKEYYRGEHGRALDAALGLYAMETKLNIDLDGDGHVGKPRTPVQTPTPPKSTGNNAPERRKITSPSVTHPNGISLTNFLKVLRLTEDQAKEMVKGQTDPNCMFDVFDMGRFDYISGKNARKLFRELQNGGRPNAEGQGRK